MIKRRNPYYSDKYNYKRLANQKRDNFDHKSSVTVFGAKKIRSTQKAWLVSINGTELWLPMNHIYFGTYRKDGRNFDVITIAGWLAKKNNITGMDYMALNSEYEYLCGE